MSESPCPHEESVGRALRTGQWSPELRDHVSGCRDCAEVEQVAGWMGRVAEGLGGGEPLPDPGLAWLKAELAEQLRREERAFRPMMLIGTLLQVGFWVALASAIFWMWPSLNAFMLGVGSWLRMLSPESLLSIGADRLLPAVTLLAVAALLLYLNARLRRLFHR